MSTEEDEDAEHLRQAVIWSLTGKEGPSNVFANLSICI